MHPYYVIRLLGGLLFLTGGLIMAYNLIRPSSARDRGSARERDLPDGRRRARLGSKE